MAWTAVRRAGAASLLDALGWAARRPSPALVRLTAGGVAWLVARLSPGDLVIGISGSGNSANVIRAIELANEKGAVTVGLSGFKGGKLAQIAQHNVITPSENMQHIEDVHMVLAHLIFRYLLEEVST